MFVVIAHVGGYAYCIKVTSNPEFYANSPELIAGCVVYKKGELKFFSEDTIIQPENQIPIPHNDIVLAEKNGSFKVLGQMPGDFREKLKGAINASIRLDARTRARILGAIPA